MNRTWKMELGLRKIPNKGDGIAKSQNSKCHQLKGPF